MRAIVPAPKGAHWQWNFGDGTTAKGDAMEHVFFGENGPWKVTIQLVGAGDSKPASASLRPITQGANAFAVAEDEEAMKAYVDAMVMADYDRAPRDVIEAVYEVVATSHRQAQMVHVAGPYVKQFGGSGALGESMRYLIAGDLAGRDPKATSTMFLELAKGASDPWLRASAAAEHLDLLMYSLGETNRLEGMIRMFMSSVDPRGKALLWSRLGDVYRLAGDARQAQLAYERAQRLSNLQLNRQQADVLMRAHREAAVNFMNTDNYPGLRDELFKWEADFPLAKLSGDLPLYIGRYYQGIGNLPRAAIEYVTLLKNNPLHPQRPEIVFRLGECLAGLNKPAEAKPWLKEIVDKYPNSPYHNPAAELLAKLN
jgi:tetratricopeptide (TPR) repeat protein